MLDTAFEALKSYDWGTDMAVLAPIEDAAAAAHKNPETGKDLEKRLIAAIQGSLSRDAHDYVCRKLAAVGTAVSVPVLAPLLVKPENSHMARYALERIPADEAGAALRDALGKVSGMQKLGVISSLGSRCDAAAITALGGLIKDADKSVSRAATLALGTIGTVEASMVLRSALWLLKPTSDNFSVTIDALLNCAEALMTGGKHVDATSIYKSLSTGDQPRMVRLAATRGLLACAAKQA